MPSDLGLIRAVPATFAVLIEVSLPVEQSSGGARRCRRPPGRPGRSSHYASGQAYSSGRRAKLRLAERDRLERSPGKGGYLDRYWGLNRLRRTSVEI